MIRSLLFIGLTLSISSSFAQDTLHTNYPQTQQRWDKIYQGGKKIAENIYHANETPWMTVQYDEKSVQEWKWYYENGNPYFEAIIVDDLLQGSYKIWYENGQLAEALFFKDNLEDGPAIFYHPNGQLAMKGEYRAGEMIGDWIFYDENGDAPNGKWVWRFAASQENIRVRGQFSNGLPTGEWNYRATANQGRSNQKQFKRLF